MTSNEHGRSDTRQRVVGKTQGGRTYGCGLLLLERSKPHLVWLQDARPVLKVATILPHLLIPLLNNLLELSNLILQ